MEDSELEAVLLRLLRPESSAGRKAGAVRVALHLSGGSVGRRLLLGESGALVAALAALTDDPSVGRAACLALLNLSAEDESAPLLSAALEPALPALLLRLLDPSCPAAAPLCALLANLSRRPPAARALLRALDQDGSGLPALLEKLCAAPAQAPPFLAPLLSNLCQLPEARATLLDPHSCLVQRLLPLTEYGGSSVCRGGVVGTLRNCCFDYERHEWLLSDKVNLLPFLLLPLAGPEEFPEDEMEKLPLDLQYLPPEKQREPDPDIRKMLLEAILLLTATKPGRQFVRQNGTYIILRELHKWERDPSALIACEKLVQVLIGDEPEAGMENLLEVEIPAEVEVQLQRLDQEEEQQARLLQMPQEEHRGGV